MEKITKSELKQIISEEVVRFKKVKSLEDKKKMLEEAIKKMEEGEDLDEISWKGIGKALGVVGDKASGAAEKAGSAVSGALEKAQTKFKTGLMSLDKGIKDFGAELERASTEGDIDTLLEKIDKLFVNIVTMFEELNKKQDKIGVPRTKLRSALMSAMNKVKTVNPKAKSSI